MGRRKGIAWSDPQGKERRDKGRGEALLSLTLV